ncbi:hypothetical protein NGI46_13185 [Peribacillus butanolivorans]|nr:hypothetical protein [Peribacillus butanolivorans]
MKKIQWTKKNDELPRATAGLGGVQEAAIRILCIILNRKSLLFTEE